MHEIMKYIFQVGIILVVGEILGMISQKLKMPKVLGFLVSGIVIGPSIFNIVQKSEPIEVMAQIGVIFLMFLAGLETEVENFKSSGGSSFIIAIGGIIVPLILGSGVTYFITNNISESIFIGVILTATSVAITVQTLNELGTLNSKAGVNIIGAAIIDDILGIIILSVCIILMVPTAEDTGIIGLMLVVGKILIFLIISGVLLKFLPKLIEKFINDRSGDKKIESFIILTVGITILFSIFAEEKFGVAAITGAYVIGLVIAMTKEKRTFENKFSNVSTYLVSPIFFSSIGLAIDIKTVNSNVILPIILITIVAILSKLLGCYIGARLYKLEKRESFQIGVGMISRGEVAIITATIGLNKGIISQDMYPILLVVIIITTIITPLLLKLVFSSKKKLI